MSHSKHRQRKYGFSMFINKWHPSSKKYINTCLICGSKGYNPVILERDFGSAGALGRVIRDSLSKTYNPLPLDALGRCGDCAGIQEKHIQGRQ